MRFLRRARRAKAGDERGFSLLETIIAVAVLTGVFTAGAAVFAGTMKGVVYARQNQQAADVVSEEIERLRGMSFPSIAMDAADLAGDADITTCSDLAKCYDADGPGPLTREPVITAVGAVVKPHVTTSTRNSTKYTVKRYVTEPHDTAGEYRRVTVVAAWRNGAKVYERRASTFVTLTRRGLPLPNFTFEDDGVASVNASDKLVLPATLTNRGARDQWELDWWVPATRQCPKSSTATRPSWTVKWYLDATAGGVGVGVWGAEDSILLDSDGDGRPESPLVDTDGAIQLFAVVEGFTNVVDTSYVVMLEAKSMGQPSSPTGTGCVKNDVTVYATAVCTGCQTYYLQNGTAAPGNSVAQSDMPAKATGVANADPLPNYDTDRDAVPGRRLLRGGAGAGETDTRLTANWWHQASRRTTYRGNATLDLWVANANDPTKKISLVVYLRYETSRNVYALHRTVATGDLAGRASFEKVSISIPVDVTVNNNRLVQVKVQAVGNGDGSYDDVVLAYDTPTYPAALVMPAVAA